MEVFVSEFGIYLAYVLFAIALVAAIILPLIKALDEPKHLMKAGVGVGGLLVVFLISWLIADNEVTAMYTTKDVGEGLSQLVGGVLTMMYLLMGIAFAAIIYTEINKTLK
jgi:hypothetical protein